MAEKSTIARPYAQAAFDLAQEAGDLKGWSDMLQTIAAVTANKDVQALIGNPDVDDHTLSEIIVDICGGTLIDKGKNFIRVLAANKRLNVMFEIAEQYEHQRAEAERTIEAIVTSAFPISKAQQKQLINALKERLGREVTLVTKTDDSIIGGAVVRAGDLVIDASITSQLEKLANTLMH
ncbi:MAG: F0F1 ATP synthase subunit delta [Proteobacteria bacterium]|jgi:F-type H+-transporting ATPase subunit delta|nr:F0F1 ATP synthase subunit delta [Pseudomonadota bacterium]